MNSLHPIMLQALQPAMPLYYHAGRAYICERTMLEDKARDEKALRLQIQAENNRTNFGRNL